jgi:putative protease
MEEKLIGKVIHYYGKINVAIVELSDNLKVGDTIHIVSGTVDFTQPVESMQIEHQNVASAKKGQTIGLLVKQKVHEGALVYLAE